VHGSDEEIDELPEIDSDEDFGEDFKHNHEEVCMHACMHWSFSFPFLGTFKVMGKMGFRPRQNT